MEIKLDVCVSLQGTFVKETITVSVPKNASDKTIDKKLRKAAETWLFEKISFTFDTIE